MKVKNLKNALRIATGILFANLCGATAFAQSGLNATVGGPGFPVQVPNQTAAYTYSSSNPAIATVDPATGVVTPIRIGSVTITATQPAVGYYSQSIRNTVVNVVAASQLPPGYFSGTYWYKKLVWTKPNGSKMSFEAAKTYCSTGTFNGQVKWRLPDTFELNEFVKASGPQAAASGWPAGEQIWTSTTFQGGTLAQHRSLNGGGGSSYPTATYHVTCVRE